MIELIGQKLDAVKTELGIRILYACESGSRAWGFASADSDYDVRVIYTWPKERYLGILPPNDTFDRGIDAENIDLSGWDIRKALTLFRKSNGPLYEWLYSPIVYFEETEIISEWRALTNRFFVPGNSIAHYLGLSTKIHRRIQEDGNVTAKKYLYVLRSLLSAASVLENCVPPAVDFKLLRTQLDIPKDVTEQIEAMIAQKSEGLESDPISRSSVLDAYIENQMQTIKESASNLPTELGPIEALDEFCRSVIS